MLLIGYHPGLVSCRMPWRLYLALTKPRVVALIVLTAVVGTLLATPGMPPLSALLWGNLGIALAAACAATLNQVLDQRIDARMARTRTRPLPTGGLTERQALAFAAILGVASMLILWFLVNHLTALLTFASLIGYAVVYTLWLKRATPQNIVIGGAAGAAPPVLGWAAVTNTVARACAAAVPDHLRLDAAAFLGAGHRAPRRLRQGGHPDAAGDARRGVHAAARAAVHGDPDTGHAAALGHRHVRADLPGRGAGPQCGVPVVCHRPEAHHHARNCR